MGMSDKQSILLSAFGISNHFLLSVFGMSFTLDPFQGPKNKTGYTPSPGSISMLHLFQGLLDEEYSLKV